MFHHIFIFALFITNLNVCSDANRTDYEKIVQEFNQSEDWSFSRKQYNDLFKQSCTVGTLQEIKDLTQALVMKNRVNCLADLWFYALQSNRSDIIDISYEQLPQKERGQVLRNAISESNRVEYYNHLKEQRTHRFEVVKKIVQTNPELIDTIKIDSALETMKLSELLLPHVTCRHQKIRAVLYAINECNAEKINLYFDLTQFSSLLQNDTFKNLEKADDLTLEQKEIIKDAYEKIDLKKLCIVSTQKTTENHAVTLCDDMLKNHLVHNLPDELLYKYIPVLMYQKMILQDDSQIVSATYTATLMQRLIKKYPNNYYQFLSTTFSDYAQRGTHRKVITDFVDCGVIADLMRSGIVPKILELEKQYENSDYQPLFHAREWYWNFVNDVWNMMQAVQHNKKTPSNRISLRYRHEKDSKIEDLLQCREKLQLHGPENYRTTSLNSTDCNSEVTCLNHSILSNSDMQGIWSSRGSEMTANYFVDGGHEHLYGQYNKLEFIKSEYSYSLLCSLLALTTKLSKYNFNFKVFFVQFLT